ncbi:MAG: PilN domain-containing protein [Parcubacteria group bacterium]|nr:PilN domain-containing protein [Parcubacteria group bacterium]
MENISLIPKKEINKEKRLPRFVTFEAPRLEFSALGKVGLGLIGVIFLFTGSLYFWKYKLAQEVKTFNDELQRLTAERDMSLENRLNDLNSVLGIFKNVLDEHRYWSFIFDVLESKTLNTVTFKSFKGSEKNNEITLDGTAPSYSALAQQVKVLEDAPNISSITTSNIGVSEDGRVKFSLKMVFAKNLIRKNE